MLICNSESGRKGKLTSAMSSETMLPLSIKLARVNPDGRDSASIAAVLETADQSETSAVPNKDFVLQNSLICCNERLHKGFVGLIAHLCRRGGLTEGTFGFRVV